MKKEQTPLGIIAGSGALPRALIATCQAQHRPVFVLALSGQAAPDILNDVPGAFIRLGSVGRAIRLFRRQGIRDITFIGGVRRPSVAEIRPDWKAFTMLVRVGFRLLGDDNLLRIILSEAEKLGFHVWGIDELLPKLLANEGVYGQIIPTKRDYADIERGIEVAKALGRVDVGQGAIVQQGLVLSVEGIEGTAKLIERTASLKRKGGGGVLVKVAKPQQDRRIDLPTIGPKTVQSIADSGLKGIAVESGSALLVEVEQMVALADKLGIFIVGVSCRKH